MLILVTPLQESSCKFCELFEIWGSEGYNDLPKPYIQYHLLLNIKYIEFISK